MRFHAMNAIRSLSVLVAVAVSSGAAQAERLWVVDPDAASIRFLYTLDGETTEGRFRSVAGTGAFDPEAPGETLLDLEIEVDSLRLDDPLETAFALSSGWFDVKNHPLATYSLSSLKGDAATGWIATAW